MNGDNFIRAFERLLQDEGEYADNPEDDGGETYRGVSRNNWPEWEGWPVIDAIKGNGGGARKHVNATAAQNSRLQDAVREFYRKNFWTPTACLSKAPALRAKIFNFGVNAGLKRAFATLQRAINLCRADEGKAELATRVPLREDGLLGPASRAALEEILRERGEDVLIDAMCEEQMRFYESFFRKRPYWGRYPQRAAFERRAQWRGTA
ncbi:MAG: hypothetical protein LBS65_05045 [Desulfovibrio sp.]|jgi:lysozyme family protein|nr:hypothetical protein [Desulfovibrio sp.]